MEGNIQLQKKRQDETNERKNGVEAYMYSLRNQLSDALAPFVTEQEQATVSDKLNQTEVSTLRSPSPACPDISESSHIHKTALSSHIVWSNSLAGPALGCLQFFMLPYLHAVHC